MTLDLGGSTEPWRHSFRAGDGSDPASPAEVTLVNGPGRLPLVNTGVRILNRLDHPYDPGQGLAGFRPRE